MTLKSTLIELIQKADEEEPVLFANLPEEILRRGSG